jgi:transcriptional regulator with XRE-family HTH domain
MESPRLGTRLRQLRSSKGLGLREAATRAGINHGYLSQLERATISQPTPLVLQKLATAYDEPFVILMRWAGYLEDDTNGLSPNQERALKIVGEPTDDELKAIRAVLDAIRSSQATFTTFDRLDGHLSYEYRNEIRNRSISLLRRADVFGLLPTPLNEVMRCSQLIAAGEIQLEPGLRMTLRQRFGDLLDRAMELILGSVRFDSREVYLKPEMALVRRRFVLAHEIGHDLLPWHRDLYAFLDDKTRIRADMHDQYERQANHAAIEILAQGDSLRREADDSYISFGLINQLASRYQISLEAAARRVIEESRQACAVTISYRGSVTGKLMPAHLYCSAPFEKRFRWQATQSAQPLIRRLSILAKSEQSIEPFAECEVSGTSAVIEVESFRTQWAVFVLFRAASNGRTLSLPRIRFPRRAAV